jgi:hypothetical protein
MVFKLCENHEYKMRNSTENRALDYNVLTMRTAAQPKSYYEPASLLLCPALFCPHPVGAGYVYSPRIRELVFPETGLPV